MSRRSVRDEEWNVMRLDQGLGFPLSGMLRSEAYSQPVSDVRLHETHISRVFLAGDLAYKIKKPVRFEFLDYSTIEWRQACCERELQVNRLFAPELYLRVAPVHQDDHGWNMMGRGPIVDWAVVMRRFSQQEMLREVLSRGDVAPSDFVPLADYIAAYHQRARRASTDPAARPIDGRLDSTTPPVIHPNESGVEQCTRPALENVSQLRDDVAATEDEPLLRDLMEATRLWAKRLAPDFEQRIRAGAIRECHGDLHLDNLILHAGKFLAFDAIEFNEAFRWIDVANELAFLVMDLDDRGHAPFASRLLDRYLEQTGDYDLLRVLRFYQSYRALVRAKVGWLKTAQQEATTQPRPLDDEARNYVRLAETYLRERRGELVITTGLSGSGKSTEAAKWVEQAGFIRLRSDATRKRLLGFAPEDSTASLGDNARAYGASVNRDTYDELLRLADIAIETGWSVIVDATFLRFEQRDTFRRWAAERGVDFGIVSCDAPLEELRARIMSRRGDASEATLEVLDRQWETRQPLTDEERSLLRSAPPPRR
ncbi:MAG: AAA family ATPase [Pirellulaceae bacterium]